MGRRFVLRVGLQGHARACGNRLDGRSFRVGYRTFYLRGICVDGDGLERSILSELLQYRCHFVVLGYGAYSEGPDADPKQVMVLSICDYWRVKALESWQPVDHGPGPWRCHIGNLCDYGPAAWLSFRWCRWGLPAAHDVTSKIAGMLAQAHSHCRFSLGHWLQRVEDSTLSSQWGATACHCSALWFRYECGFTASEVAEIFNVSRVDRDVFVESLNAVAFHQPKRFVAYHLYLVSEWLGHESGCLTQEAQRLASSASTRLAFLSRLRGQQHPTAAMPLLKVFDPSD